MKKSVKTYLLLGTNIGDRMSMLQIARQSVAAEVGEITRSSHIYETEPWGERDQPDFYNQVIEVQTTLSPEALLQSIHRIEKNMGRTREQQWQPRTIDIDILIYGNEVIMTEDLIIPHPHMQYRNFTLIPLMEIIPLVIHPVLNKSIEDLYLESKDELEVIRIEEN